MISLDDIVDMCDLSRDEIAAVAEHDHIGTADAALLGDYLMHQHHGPAHVQSLICDDIRDALHADDLVKARNLWAVLRHYLAQHPEAVRGVDPT